MPDYIAPVRDMQFAITALAGLKQLAALPGYAECTADLVDAVLEGAAALAGNVLSPLNKLGDQQGATLSASGVVVAAGFGPAYGQFVEDGWNALSADPAFGGQGLPNLLGAATSEMWYAANMAFALCPMLTGGAVEALRAHASERLKAIYLSKMVSGEWTGTMNLTEPQSGSDLSTVRTRAVAEGEHYRISGQKIFITWGDHDMTKNVIHLVLARLPDAPEGVKGISLFLVPKFLVNMDGSLGARNDAHCTALEHKLGIHASPTCVMTFGETEGAIGYLVGELNNGLANMFTMMNEARQKVGIQGVAIAERAYQGARDYAKERVQGRSVQRKSSERVSIINHPDVRRMLLTMKSQIEAMRAFCYVAATDVDFAHHHPDPTERQRHQARVDMLTPVLKGWCTELGVEIASLAVQVFGGMGFIEETGAAQHLRDARITTIYEGTTGIQAADLVGRKLPMQQGAAMAELVAEMRATLGEVRKAEGAVYADIARRLAAGISALEHSSTWMLDMVAQDQSTALSGSVNYMMLTGYVCGGWQLARAALEAGAALREHPGDEFYQAKLTTAGFYATQILPKASALAVSLQSGVAYALALPEGQY